MKVCSSFLLYSKRIITIFPHSFLDYLRISFQSKAEQGYGVTAFACLYFQKWVESILLEELRIQSPLEVYWVVLKISNPSRSEMGKLAINQRDGLKMTFLSWSYVEPYHSLSIDEGPKETSILSHYYGWEWKRGFSPKIPGFPFQPISTFAHLKARQQENFLWAIQWEFGQVIEATKIKYLE